MSKGRTFLEDLIRKKEVALINVSCAVSLMPPGNLWVEDVVMESHCLVTLEWHSHHMSMIHLADDVTSCLLPGCVNKQQETGGKWQLGVWGWGSSCSLMGRVWAVNQFTVALLLSALSLFFAFPVRGSSASVNAVTIPPDPYKNILTSSCITCSYFILNVRQQRGVPCPHNLRGYDWCSCMTTAYGISAGRTSFFWHFLLMTYGMSRMFRN